jgi:signal transduction histidine kinase
MNEVQSDYIIEVSITYEAGRTVIQTSFGQQKSLGDFFKSPWLVIIAGLVVQVGVIVMLLISIQQPALPDVTLTAVAGNTTVCRLVSVNPFSDAWVRGVQPGTLVQPLGEAATSLKDCAATNRPVQVQVVGQGKTFVVSPQIEGLNFVDVVLTGILMVIFSVTGSSIYLRAQDRPTAGVAYALFYCTSLVFCLLNLHGFNYLWANALLFFLAMIIRGLSTTFVCLFPYPSKELVGRKKISMLPYLPLGIGLVLVALSVPIFIFIPDVRLSIIFVTVAYNVACIVIVIWVMFWGLRGLNRDERQLARMVVVGVVFLLLPLAVMNIVRIDTFVTGSLIRLVPIPLAVLPIACDYALFRRHLVGSTSLLSRHVMRVLLWLLLASLFIFPAILLLNYIDSSVSLQDDVRGYIYAGLLVLSLCLFPLIWNKVRDVGDQVFYHDFYQYNRSLGDLSAELTRLQGLDQISTFVLPGLATLLNATDAALLIRSTPQRGFVLNTGNGATSSWHIYHHPAPQCSMPTDRLVQIANLALTHLVRPSYDALLLDDVLLLALYDGDSLSGFLCLGPKSNREPYSRQDKSFLATLAAQLAVLEVNSRYLEQAQADAQKLAALNHRVVSAQENERRRLALELHDEALQEAMLVVRQLSDASTMTEVAEVMPRARAVVTSLRHTCLELRPPLLDELGLEEALYWLAQQNEQISGGEVQIKVICTGAWQTRPPADVELALYRVGQEALSNVIKYAGASRVTMRLRRTPCEEISLLISDNGRGFKQGQPLAESLGLVGMHERMVAIGGQLQIRTGRGRGVTIRAVYRPALEASQPLIYVDTHEMHKQERRHSVSFLGGVVG